MSMAKAGAESMVPTPSPPRGAGMLPAPFPFPTPRQKKIPKKIKNIIIIFFKKKV